MIVLVTYDLRKGDHDYGPFYSALKDQGTWWHYISSTWLLKTNKRPYAIAEALRPHMDGKDNLFVTEITTNNAGYLSDKAWAWLRRNEEAET